MQADPELQDGYFRDRAEAGARLAAALQAEPVARDTVVLALPRGGVPTGFAISRALGLPLEPLVVRKLGVPHFPELALGALAAGGQCQLDRELQQRLGISDAAVEAVRRREQAELERRAQRYPMSVPLPALAGRPVILVDDGMATGSTMLAALASLRSVDAGPVTIAVPVAAREAADRLAGAADRMVALSCPEPFGAVGQWYGDFRQVDEQEVADLLARAQRLPAPDSSTGSMASH